MDKKYTPFLIIGGAIVAYYLWNKNKKEKEASAALAPATGGANPSGEEEAASEFGGRFGGRFGMATRRSFGSVAAPVGKVKYKGDITNAPQGCPPNYRSRKLPNGQYGCVAISN